MTKISVWNAGIKTKSLPAEFFIFKISLLYKKQMSDYFFFNHNAPLSQYNVI